MEKEVGRMLKGSHVWFVKNYSRDKKQLGVGKAVESNEFIAGGHLWTMMFYPNGLDLDAHNKGYTSIYLTLKDTSVDNYPVQFLHEIYVVNQSAGGVDLGFSLFKVRQAIPCLRRSQQCGTLYFIDRAVLESPDYLRDDCLRIRCTVGVLACPIQDHPLLMSPESAAPALVISNGCRYLKQICSSLFQKRVRFKQTHTSGQGELDLCSKILSVGKGSFVSIIWHWDASNKKQLKIKED